MDGLFRDVVGISVKLDLRCLHLVRWNQLQNLVFLPLQVCLCSVQTNLNFLLTSNLLKSQLNRECSRALLFGYPMFTTFEWMIGFEIIIIQLASTSANYY